MNWTSKLALCFTLAIQTAFAGPSGPTGTSGQVQIPLETYQQWLLTLQAGGDQSRERFAYGPAQAEVQINGESAEISTRLTLDVLSDSITSIPLFFTPVAITQATVDGQTLTLSSCMEGLCLLRDKKGTHHLDLTYKSDVLAQRKARVLSFPLPRASATSLRIVIPGAGRYVTIPQATALTTRTEGDTTVVEATISGGALVTVRWEDHAQLGMSIPRASYKGVASEASIIWLAEFIVESDGEEKTDVPLLPAQLTLSDVSVDGKSVAVAIDQASGRFTVPITGKGTHKVKAEFSQTLQTGQGPRSTVLPLLQVPVSKVELILKGSKELQVSPAAAINYERSEKETKATFNVPVASEAQISWVETLSQDAVTDLRAEASIYHAATIEEGLLSVRAFLEYQVQRGKTESLQLEVPKGVDVSRVEARNATITDWRVERAKTEGKDTLAISFDRAIENQITLTVYYDQPIPQSGTERSMQMPLLQALGVYHQRGMLALLASKELAINPSENSGLTRVGESQLPATVREQLTQTITHTFRYQDPVPALAVQVVPAEKKQARFEVQYATLYSLQDVSLRTHATIDLNIKAGALSEITLVLPKSLNVLSLTAPSLRSHSIETTENAQHVHVQFTQELDGQIRLELLTESLLVQSESRLDVPVVQVVGAEIEQGKLGVEALSAIEVQAEETKGLSSLDVSELPQHLVLKTSNPMLLAYKYVRTGPSSADPVYRLGLKLTRHQGLELHNALVERAQYQTLVTQDAVTITRATFYLKNSGRQFLRLRLPSGAELWSAEVNGVTEKPAMSQGENPEVLLRVINSDQVFPVSVVYQLKSSPLNFFGRFRIEAALPDLVVSESLWELYFPQDARLLSVDSSFEPLENAQRVQSGGPGNIMNVPMEGQKLAFRKLYSNKGSEQAYVRLVYARGFGDFMGFILVVLMSLSLVYGATLSPTPGWKNRFPVILGVAGLVVLVGMFHFSAMPALIVFIAALLMRRQQPMSGITQDPPVGAS